MWINWRVYVDGTDCSGVGTTGAGQGSKCRVIVRGMSPNGDPQSLVASEPVCIVNGTYLSDLGGTNDDVYVANLNTCNPQLPNGRYSVEIQCDCVSGDYTTNTAIATWIYNTPSPYYIRRGW
ncbi:MAG: hypothetical protein H6554_03905 [Chitinophagales bacterium]|nr:hypothetical protein [Chitinophagales bacterium]